MIRRPITKAATLLTFAAVGVAFTATTALAGSDSPTPYVVDASGVTLPAGEVFPAHGHVNVRTADGASFGLHLDPNNNQPGAAWIGAASIPWTALGIPTTACVAWVQISTHDEHYGEGGQGPVCLTPTATPTASPTFQPTPEPTWTPTPTASPTPSPEPTTSPTSGQPSPEPSASPAPTTTRPSTPQPSTPAPTPSTSSSPSSSTEPSATPTTAPTGQPSGTPTGPASERAEVSAAGLDDERSGELAATGIDPGLAAALSLATLVAGIAIVATEKRMPR